VGLLRNLVLAGGIIFVGCSTVEVPDHPGAIASIQNYYHANAWEEGARCVSPSMQMTQTKVLEDTTDRLVVEARYY
jgi:hypothetical protein